MPTLGFDLGGTKVLAVALGDDGRVLAEERRPTPGGPETFVALAAALVAEMQRATSGITALGIGAAGLVDGAGNVRFAPNMPGFVEVPLRSRLVEATGLVVVVDNDANAAAWGEVSYGAARGKRHVLMVTLGTGIGGGIIADGHVYRGAHGYAAEIGHFSVPSGERCACGEIGHWEAVASGAALGRLAREQARRGEAPSIVSAAGNIEAITGHDVATAAGAGAADALNVLDEFAVNVAVGLAGLANVLDPEMIVIGGGLVGMGDLLLDRVRAAFTKRIEAATHREPIAIVAAALGERSGAIGAAFLAREITLGQG